MTTSFKQFENWVSEEITEIEAKFTSEEAAVMKFLAPLGAQILAAAKALGKESIKEGIEVLKSSATLAVAAGAAAEASGGDAIKAAEEAFLGSAGAGGATVIHNAEAGAIKAAVAIAQAAIVEAAQAEPAVDTVVS
jgi:hypothetical protein